MVCHTVIIGAGVAGMTAAIYLKRANIDVLVLEKDIPGGQITRTSTIENYPGFISISGADLALNIYNQVTNLNIPFLYTEVTGIIDSKHEKIVETTNGKIKCKNVIISTGRSPKKLGVKNEEKLLGHGISYCATCDGSLFKNCDVAVVGGGMSAIQGAIYLSKICNHVTLIHRRDSFKADSTLIQSVKNINNISIITNKNVNDFVEENGKLIAINLIDVNTNEVLKISVDGCFIYIGQVPDTKLFSNLNIIDNNGYIEVNNDFKTRINNIYAVGDCIKKDLYQIISACSDGAKASNVIIKNDN